MTLRRLLACAAVGALALSGAAGAQDETEPPCPPGVPAGATIRARDIEDYGGAPLTATHTIELDVVTSDGTYPDFTTELPPGVVKRGRGRAFQADRPGPVPVKVTWREFDPGAGSFCRASAEASFEMQAAKPLRYFPPRRRTLGGADGTVWLLLVPKDADLRPVDVRVRGVQRGRVPRASDPLKVVTFALREGDKGLTYGGRSIRTVRSGGWLFDVTFGNYTKLTVQMRAFARRGGSRRFGIDLQLVQGDRQIGHNRFVGECLRYNICSYRPR
jgi:hypothetical protein